MDPNTLLEELQSALVTDTRNDEVDNMCDDLRNWIVRGGFAPSWNKCPLAKAYYFTRQALRIKYENKRR